MQLLTTKDAKILQNRLEFLRGKIREKDKTGAPCDYHKAEVSTYLRILHFDDLIKSGSAELRSTKENE